MAAKSKFRGNEIELIDGKWFFTITGKLVSETHESMPCGYCHSRQTNEGHDECLGTLIGVMNACCGHGNVEEAYVQFLDSTIIRGKSAKIILTELRKNKNGE